MSYIQFLKSYEVGKDELYNFTCLPPFDTEAGKYFIPSSQYGEFAKLFCEWKFDKNKTSTLTEKHPANKSKLCVDFDFRFFKGVDSRQYTEDHIFEMTNIYTQSVKQIVPEDKHHLIKAYVFQKNKVSKFDHDGIHIMYPEFELSYLAQHAIRELAIASFSHLGFFEAMGCSNETAKIIDKAVVERNNWFVYGATKVNDQPYLLTHIFNPDMSSQKPELSNLEIFKKMCLHNTEGTEFIEIPKFIKTNEVKKKVIIKKKIEKEVSMASTNYGSSSDEESGFDDGEMVEMMNTAAVQKMNKKMKKAERIFVEKLLGLINKKRTDDYSEWFVIGAALHNESDDYLDLWKEWSSQSYKYNEDVCDTYWENNFKSYSGSYKATLNKIKSFARMDNEKEYLALVDKYHAQDDYYCLLKRGLEMTHTDVASILYFLYKDCFVYSEKEWFQYEGHRWKPLFDNPVELRKKMSNELINHYLAFAAHLNMKALDASTIGNEKLRDECQELMGKCYKVTKLLKTVSFKNSVVEEMKEMFYQEKFRDELDTDEYLLGFNNGVYNLKTGEFREGLPEDKVSFSCGYDFNEKVDPDVRKQVFDVIYSIQPDPEVRKFILAYFATSLIGTNLNEIFPVFEGSGGNGKGMLTTLHDSALGDYAGILNNNYVVNTFNNPESHNTMLASNYKKRSLQINEPPNTKQLNMNLIKELTGRDKIQLRVAHSAHTKTVVPMFSIVMLCNEMPKIENTKDGGFNRRFVGVNFPHSFVETKPKTLYEKQADPELKEKIKLNKEWHQQYMLILLEHLKEYLDNGKKLDVPVQVKQNSNKLMKEQDPIDEFVEDFIQITGDKENDYVRRDCLWEEFRRFHKQNYTDKLRINAKQFEDRLLKIFHSISKDFEFKKRVTITNGDSKQVICNAFFGVQFYKEESTYHTMNEYY